LIFKVEFVNFKVEHFKGGENLPIVEYKRGEAGKFIEEMKEMLDKEKSGPNRFKLYITSGNRRIVFQPQVTTQRVNTLLIRDYDAEDVKAISEFVGPPGIKIKEVWNFWFDERKEPPTKVAGEEKKETQ
jgi:hypothetical protein